jgi:hypothetical protein
MQADASDGNAPRRNGAVGRTPTISTTLNIYTHVVDESLWKAVEQVEARLFGEMNCSGLKSAAGLEHATPASGACRALTVAARVDR